MIGEVQEIEQVGSSCKRPLGPLIFVRVLDIETLPGCIRIPMPSLTEGAVETTFKEILVSYSGLPNQCNRCLKFDHVTKDCLLHSKNKQGENSEPKVDFKKTFKAMLKEDTKVQPDRKAGLKKDQQQSVRVSLVVTEKVALE